MTLEVTYKTDLHDIDWDEMKSTLAEDRFDNGRTASELRESFENSRASVVALLDDRIVGTARALSDGVCSAYIVDVWTLSTYRRRGIARKMMGMLQETLYGQHVYLFTDDAVDFYKAVGFEEQAVGLGKIVGTWLRRDAQR